MIKNLITILGLVLLLFFGYYIFVLDSGGLELNNQLVASQADAETREFLVKLNELKTIDLQTEILNDDRFRNLVDYSSTVRPSVVGRNNPFAPVN